jgi:hypothetical protein
MWGYQEYFQLGYESLARSVFEKIGFESTANVLLVGLARPDREVRHVVCLSPENGRWSQELFATLPTDAERARVNHPGQHMFYGDEPTMREKPENIRRRAISEEVDRHLRLDDERHGVRSFCSIAVPYGDYYIVMVIQVPIASLDLHPAIKYRSFDKDGETNLVLACIREVQDQAVNELQRPWPEPGRGLGSAARLTPEEIVERAARSLLRVPFIAGDWMNPGLFEPIEHITKLLYERQAGRGTFILAAENDPNINYVVRLKQPVRLRQARWVRKLVQMATGKAALIAGYNQIYGVGSVSDVSDAPYMIDVVGPHQWDLRRGDQTFLRVRQGVCRLPQEPIASNRFEDNARRIFPGIGEPSIARMRNVMNLLLQLQRGSMIVFAKDASSEAERLEGQGTTIQPTAITLELLERATAIDGTILADPEGVCYAIGVILDGEANPDCTPGRGSRYNSAVRYAGDGTSGRLALVVSDDATLDVVPLLRIRVDRSELENAVQEIEIATLDSYHKLRNYLEQRRFYLDSGQCSRINSALDRIESEPTGVGRIIFRTERFEPNPAMNERYFIPAQRK